MPIALSFILGPSTVLSWMVEPTIVARLRPLLTVGLGPSHQLSCPARSLEPEAVDADRVAVGENDVDLDA